MEQDRCQTGGLLRRPDFSGEFIRKTAEIAPFGLDSHGIVQKQIYQLHGFLRVYFGFRADEMLI